MRVKTGSIAAISALLLAGCGPLTRTIADQLATSPAGPPSACETLAGIVDADHICQIHTTQPGYSVDLSFPADLSDQKFAITTLMDHDRRKFVDHVATLPPRAHPYELKIQARAYRSGDATSGTRSLVFKIYRDEGVPRTTYLAYVSDVATRSAITFDGLFKPGSRPLDVLDPIVRGELARRGAPQPPVIGEGAYLDFAITDDAVMFFIGQVGGLPEGVAPLEVTVPRAVLAPLLA
jgi:hypothetical protein